MDEGDSVVTTEELLPAVSENPVVVSGVEPSVELPELTVVDPGVRVAVVYPLVVSPFVLDPEDVVICVRDILVELSPEVLLDCPSVLDPRLVVVCVDPKVELIPELVAVIGSAVLDPWITVDKGIVSVLDTGVVETTLVDERTIEVDWEDN